MVTAIRLQARLSLVLSVAHAGVTGSGKQDCCYLWQATSPTLWLEVCIPVVLLSVTVHTVQLQQTPLPPMAYRLIIGHVHAMPLMLPTSSKFLVLNCHAFAAMPDLQLLTSMEAL